MFTDEQVEFIRSNLKNMSTRKVAEAYSKEFGEALGQTQLRRVCEQYGIQNPREEYKPKPIGYEKWSDYYQCMIVKVKQVSVKGMKPSAERHALRQSQWQMKQNYIWEHEHGMKLPSDMMIVFLDGDRTNYDPANLYAAHLEEIGYVYRTKIASENPKIMESALLTAKLVFTLAERRKGS